MKKTILWVCSSVLIVTFIGLLLALNLKSTSNVEFHSEKYTKDSTALVITINALEISNDVFKLNVQVSTPKFNVSNVYVRSVIYNDGTTLETHEFTNLSVHRLKPLFKDPLLHTYHFEPVVVKIDNRAYLYPYLNKSADLIFSVLDESQNVLLPSKIQVVDYLPNECISTTRFPSPFCNMDLDQDQEVFLYGKNVGIGLNFEISWVIICVISAFFLSIFLFLSFYTKKIFFEKIRGLEILAVALTFLLGVPGIVQYFKFGKVSTISFPDVLMFIIAFWLILLIALYFLKNLFCEDKT